MGGKGNNGDKNNNNGGAAFQAAPPAAEPQEGKEEQPVAEEKPGETLDDGKEKNNTNTPDTLPYSLVAEFAWCVVHKLRWRCCTLGFRLCLLNLHFQIGLMRHTIDCRLINYSDKNEDCSRQYGVPMFLLDKLWKKHSSMTWGYVMRCYLYHAIEDYKNHNSCSFPDAALHHFYSRFSILYSPYIFTASRIPNIRFQYQFQEGSSDKPGQIRRFLFESAEDFCSKFVPEYNSGLFRRRKAAKWSADGMAFDRYRMLWNKKIEEAGEKAKPYKDYIEYVISVMKDANRWSGQHLKQWKSYKKHAIILPALAALLSAAAAAYTSESFLNLFKDKQDIVKVIQICFLLVSAVASCITAIENATKDSGNEPRETWLRQKHLYAKLDLETKRYLYNLGDYKITAENNTLTSQVAQPVQNGQPAQPAQTVPDEQKKKEKAMELLRLYVKKIGDLQKEDWSNFFTNMNCPNYDKEYFEKDE